VNINVIQCKRDLVGMQVTDCQSVFLCGLNFKPTSDSSYVEPKKKAFPFITLNNTINRVSATSVNYFARS
jgi:hypothetical protein